MTTTNHTPGPWTVQACAPDHGETTCIGTADGFTVASIASAAWDAGATLEYPQDTSNARLIAQAPAMLMRLEGVCLTAANMLGELNSGRDIPAAVLRLEMENLIRDTRATIAAAKGS